MDTLQSNAPPTPTTDVELTEYEEDKAEAYARLLLEEGSNVPVDQNPPQDLPPWYDHQLFTRGQDYFFENYFALFVSKLAGLLAILAIPSILDVLVLTQRSSQPITAFKRYLDTLTHMLHWYTTDINNTNMQGQESAKWVRARHCSANAMARAGGRGFISQRDMALTQFGFMGFALLRQQRLGLVGQPQGFIHFWRVIGYLMGIQDRFNLCGESEAVTRRACSLLASRVFRPALEAPPQKFPDMSRALLDAMRVLIPTLEPRAFLQFSKMLCDIPPTSDLTFISKMNLHLQLFVHKLLATSVIALVLRPILNFHIWLAVFITQRWPFIAAFQLGREVNASHNVNNVQST